jgi:hypothetical protein
MKLQRLAAVLLLFLSGCSDDENSPARLAFTDYSGIWVPYEIQDSTGEKQQGPFTANSGFGVYAESVLLNNDGTYVPVTWFDRNTYTLKTEEAGNFEFNPTNNKLILTGGVWDLEFEIVHYSDDLLWLSSDGFIYRMKREIWQ